MTRRVAVLTTRWSLVAFAVLASLLVVTTAPAAAVNTAVVQGGTHTDDGDFSNATLDNMTVTGSGDTASVVASTGGSDIDISNTSSTGASHTFQLGDYDSVTSGPALQMTGEENTEPENASYALTSGGSVTHDVAGNAESNATVTITGKRKETARTASGTTSGGSSSLTVYGNVDPPSPTLSISPSSTTTVVSGGSTNYDADHVYGTWSGTGVATTFNFDVKMDAGHDDQQNTVEIWLADRSAHVGPSTDPELWTKIDTRSMDTGLYGSTDTISVSYSGDKEFTSGDIGIYVDADVSSDFKLQDVNIETADPLGGDVSTGIDSASIPVAGGTRNLDVEHGSESLNWDITSGGSVDWTLDYTARTDTIDPSVAVNGTEVVSYTGTLSDGQTISSNTTLSPGANDLALSGSGDADVQVEWTEVTQTQDPGVELNGNAQTYTGTLGDGNTTTFTWDSSMLNRNGENTVKVSLPDLSADAPEMQADYHFYTTTTKKWSSAEYISPTYDLANVTEMQVDVVMENATGTFYAEKYDGSSWQSVASTSITTNDTHTLNFSDITDSDQVRARVTFDKTDDSPYAEIKSDTAFFRAHGPTTDGLDPPDTQGINDESVNLSAVVDDWDFDTTQTDTVTAEIYLDGTQVDSFYNLMSESTISYQTGDLDEGQHSWYVTAQDSYGVSHTSETYTFTVEHYAPTFDESSATPTGGLSQPANTFSINISDRDFAETSGDTVTAELYVDGAKAGEDTVTVNGTATVSTTVSEGGDHEYYWVATDEYGKTTQSQTYSLSVPSTLTVVDEQTGKVINDSSVTVQFYNQNLVVERTTSDGNISMTGLPVDNEFVVLATTDGYYQRRIILPSLYDQSKVYLLNKSANATQVEFRLRDLTGNFNPDDTRLYIQKGITDSNTTTYQTIAGDYFGADGSFPVALERNQRYLLSIENTDGDRRDVGYWMATVEDAGIRVIDVGQIQPPPRPEDEGWVAQVQSKDAGTSRYVLFKYRDSAYNVSELSLRIYERGNKSNEVLDMTATDVGQEYYRNVSLPESDATWMVAWNATRNGEQVGQVIPVEGSRVAPEFPLGAPWPGTLGLLSIMFVVTLGGGSYMPEGLMAASGISGMLMVLQIVNIEPTFWMLAALVSTSAIGVKYWGARG